MYGGGYSQRRESCACLCMSFIFSGAVTATILGVIMIIIGQTDNSGFTVGVISLVVAVALFGFGIGFCIYINKKSSAPVPQVSKI